MFVFVLFENNIENEVCVRERHFHWWARNREVAREPELGCRALLPCLMAYARRHARAMSCARATAARTAKSFPALAFWSSTALLLGGCNGGVWFISVSFFVLHQKRVTNPSPWPLCKSAGGMMERQLRVGLVGEEAIPETSASKDPCERTPIANERAQGSSLHAQTHPRCSASVARTIHSPLSR